MFMQYIGLASVRKRKDSATVPHGTLPTDLSLPGPSGISVVSSPDLNSQPVPGSSGLSVDILSALSSSIVSALTSGVVAPGSSGLSHSGSSHALTSEPASRTTAWRHERERKMGKSAKPHRAYTCKACGRPMTSEGHTQFFGQRYCPHEPGQLSQDAWLQQKRQEAARRKQQGN